MKVEVFLEMKIFLYLLKRFLYLSRILQKIPQILDKTDLPLQLHKQEENLSKQSLNFVHK